MNTDDYTSLNKKIIDLDERIQWIESFLKYLELRLTGINTQYQFKWPDKK